MHCLQREVGGMATKKCDGCCWPARGRVGLITTSLERSCLNKLIKQWGLNSSRHFVGPLRFILVHVEQYILFIIRSRVSAGGFWEVPYLASAFMCGVGKVKTFCEQPQLLLSSLTVPTSMARLKMVFSLMATPI